MGDEGFMNDGGDGSYPYTTAEGMDFEANLKIPVLPFCLILHQLLSNHD
jgi:mannan endo-1,4-beta-mannosidase